MTIETKYAPHRTVLPTLMLAALLLAGCSSGNIGDSWQCPLAKGGSCESVAAADPAVPDAGAARRTLLTEPLWRQRAGEPAEPAAAPCEAECGGGFDPFGWLVRLFGGDGEDRAAPEETEPDAAASRPVPVKTHSRTAEQDTAPLPAEPQPGEPQPGEDDQGEEHPGAGDLRTGEVVARIWIAPFVDAGGVYREASHVRVVLEPAGWRLPR